MSNLSRAMLFLGLLGFTFNALAQKQITFNVDATTIGSYHKDSLLSIGLRGNVPPLSWVRDIKLLDKDKDGVYSITVPFNLTKDKEVYFKYVLNIVEWEAGDAYHTGLTKKAPDTVNTKFRYVRQKANPFKKFIGQWTLKNDLWFQANSHDKIDTLFLPNHHTVCKEINTTKSLLFIVESTSARGHALWTYNESTKEVFAQSSFNTTRIGLGSGTVDADGNIQLKIGFAGNEPDGTYRKYTYDWVNDDSYILKSYQYDEDHQPTGNFYGGTFVRIKTEK